MPAKQGAGDHVQHGMTDAGVPLLLSPRVEEALWTVIERLRTDHTFYRDMQLFAQRLQHRTHGVLTELLAAVKGER